MAPAFGRSKVGFLGSALQIRRSPSRGGRARRVGRATGKDNPGWGYDRIVGALANLGHPLSDQTVGNILRRRGLGIAPERKRQTTWAEFIRRHKRVLWATDFFATEVGSAAGLVTTYALFFIHLQTRKVILGGVTHSPNEAWVKQIARNVTGVTGELTNARYLIHDRDSKYSAGLDCILEGAGIAPLKLMPRTPNLNAYAERWIGSVKNECLDMLKYADLDKLQALVLKGMAQAPEEQSRQPEMALLVERQWLWQGEPSV